MELLKAIVGHCLRKPGLALTVCFGLSTVLEILGMVGSRIVADPGWVEAFAAAHSCYTPESSTDSGRNSSVEAAR